MIAVGLSEEGVIPYLAQVLESTVVIACVNAPSNVTLSGDESSIDQILKALTEDGVFVRKLRVKTAYHSHHVCYVPQYPTSSFYSFESIEPWANPKRYMIAV
jgi:acyl transferase domain-containing protein